ncbi:FUSC family protein [Roseomonas elaeocarpi]|uniref:FUSC family protein n=1 Tax=Roseomonas elaeocarpi TaxID=907779 RepID=A0ABV6JTP9_9PROT
MSGAAPAQDATVTVPSKAETGWRWLWRAMPRISPAWAQVLRTLAAFTIALYSAYALELDSPSSAGLTVLIVANSSRGAVLSKSVYRLLGTLVGAVVSIVLIALFNQAPWLFIIAFAVWLGFCTFLASLLRYFRSYGAVLAGYTIALIGVGAVANPENVFTLAAARVAVISLGVLSTALVFLVTDRGNNRSAITAQLSRAIAGSATFIRDLLRGGGFAETRALGSSVIAQVEAMDQVVEFTAVENTGISRHADGLRLANAAIFTVLASGRRTAELLLRPTLAGRADVSTARGLIESLTERLATLQNASVELRKLQADTHAAADEVSRLMATCDDLEAMACLLRARALLNQFVYILDSLVALHDDKPRAPQLRLKAYVNPVTALRNGARAGIALFLGGAFWIISGWSSGGAMLTLLGPICALLGTMDSAAKASVGFFQGLLVAVLLGTAITYCVLPLTAGFPLLLTTLAPFLALGILASQRPRWAGQGTAFLIFFVATISPGNPMTYDLEASLNSLLANIVGGACGVLTFYVLLPANPPAEARVLQRSLRNSVVRVTRGSLPPWLRWENLQHQKLVRLSRRLAAIAPERSAAAFTDGGGALLVGRALIRVRQAIAEKVLPPAEQRVAQDAVKSFARVIEDPVAVAAQAHQAACQLAAPAEVGQPAFQVAALLYEAAELTERHADFFARRGAWAAATPGTH